MTELTMIIAQCPTCGCRRYSWDEEDAIEKLSHHVCSASLLDMELAEILDRILEEKTS